MKIWKTESPEKTREYTPDGAESGDISSASDDSLIQSVVARDQQAFKVIYHRYYQGLYRFISRITGQYGSTEEAVNDAMYVVWDKAAKFRRGTRLSTWIFGIAYNKALKSLERGRRYQDPKYRESLDEEHTLDPDARYERLETENWLLEGMSQLSPQHRATLELTYYYGMSCREVADVMNCNESTVKTRMFYARRKMRAILPTLANRSRSEGV